MIIFATYTVLFVVVEHILAAVRATARAAANRGGWNAEPRPPDLSHNACAWAKFERPKNACVFEGGRIWWST